jgi:hypothetical protein
MGGVGIVGELEQDGTRIKMPKTDIESNLLMAYPLQKIHILQSHFWEPFRSTGRRR